MPLQLELHVLARNTDPNLHHELAAEEKGVADELAGAQGDGGVVVSHGCGSSWNCSAESMIVVRGLRAELLLRDWCRRSVESLS
jgi:hypothetical protein